MNNVMTIDQIISAAKGDISRQIAKGTWKGYDDTDDNEENFYTIVSLYAQWAEDIALAEESLWAMFVEDYPDYDHANCVN